MKTQSRDDILKSVDMQVSRDIDFVRARQYWGKVLEETPKEVLAEALSMALASGRYQMARPRNCGRGCPG